MNDTIPIQSQSTATSAIFRAVIFSAAAALAGLLAEQALRIVTGNDLWGGAVSAMYFLLYFVLLAAGLSAFTVLVKNRIEPGKLWPLSALYAGGLSLAIVAVSFIDSVSRSGEWWLRLGLALLAAAAAPALSGLAGRLIPRSIAFLAFAGIFMVWLLVTPEAALGLSARWAFLLTAAGLLILGAYALNMMEGVTGKGAGSAVLALIVLNALAAWGAAGLMPGRAGADEAPPAQAEPSEGKVTPVIVLVLDTVRSESLSLYGCEEDTTPFLEEMAEDSLVFDNFKSVATYTLPSHATLFTGLRPHEHYVYHRYAGDDAIEVGETWPLPEGSPTLAEVMKRNGYSTAAYSANFVWLSPTYGMDRGFDTFVNKGNPAWVRNIKSGLADQFFQTGLAPRVAEWAGIADMKDFMHQNNLPYFNAFEMSARAKDWLSRRGVKEPSFLFINYMDAHGPYHYPSKYEDSIHKGFDVDYALGFTDYTGVLSRTRTYGEDAEPVPLSEDAGKRIKVSYERSIGYLDDALRDFIDYLKKAGLYEPALIVIVSDHGEMLGEKTLLNHTNGHVYEELTAVPLIIKTPYSKQIGRVSELAQTHQIFEYVIRCSTGRENECAWPPGGEGLDSAYSEWHRQGPEWKALLGDAMAYYEDDKKIILRTGSDPVFYDLGSDPEENHDLFGKGPGSSEFDGDLSRAKEIFEKMLAPAPRDREKRISSENVDDLKALGYIQ